MQMSKADQSWSFQIAADGNVILLINGSELTLGAKEYVLPDMEAFLAEAEHTFEPRFLGRTIDGWDKRWISAGPLEGDFSPFRKSVGLYRAVMGDQIMYIGKACEYANGGLRKRLADYTRESPSARMTGAGPLLWLNRNRITIDLLIVGEEASAARITEQLEGRFIERYAPPWNTVGRSRK